MAGLPGSRAAAARIAPATLDLPERLLALHASLVEFVQSACLPVEAEYDAALALVNSGTPGC